MRWNPGPHRINRAHRLAQDMVVAFSPLSRRNLVAPSQSWVYGSSAAAIPTPLGMATTHNGASDAYSIEFDGAAIVTSDGAGTGDFTMMCWGDPFSESRASGVFTQRSASPACIAGIFASCNSSFAASAGTFTAMTHNSTGGALAVEVSGAVDGVMNCYAVTRSGTTVTAWVNGRSRGTNTGTARDITETGIGTKIGGSAKNTSSFFADAEIPFSFAWNRALSAAEIWEMFDPYTRWAVLEGDRRRIWVPGAAASAPDRTTGAEFDGTNDYLVRGADLTGAADGKQGTVAFWYKRGATTSFQYLLSNDNVRFVVAQNTADEIEFRARNGSGTLILQGYTNTDPPLDEWVHVMASWDLATTTLHVYRNGLSDLKSAPTVTNDTIDYTGGNFIVGAGNSSGVSKLTGCLAEVWFDDVYVDLSDSANRAKFYVSGAQPPDLGSDGSAPTGGAPLLYLSGGAAQFEDNFGTGGAFTVNGALVDCPLPTFLATNLASLTISEHGQATGHGTALASDTITELGQATGHGTALASDTITEHGQAEGVITALDALTKAGHSAAFGAAIATVLASLTKQGQGALLGLVSALDSLSILERAQVLGLITSTASKTITEHTAGISTGAGGAVSTNLASLTKLGLAAGVTVWEIGDALAAAYDDLPEYFAAGELVDADLAAYLDSEMGFAETVTVGASEIAGIFDDHSTAGGAVDGPRLVVKTSDVTAQAIDQGSVLTIRGRTFHVWGVQRDGVGVSTLVLREPS